LSREQKDAVKKVWSPLSLSLSPMRGTWALIPSSMGISCGLLTRLSMLHCHRSGLNTTTVLTACSTTTCRHTPAHGLIHWSSFTGIRTRASSALGAEKCPRRTNQLNLKSCVANVRRLSEKLIRSCKHGQSMLMNKVRSSTSIEINSEVYGRTRGPPDVTLCTYR